MKITELPISLSPVEKVILKESFVSISHNETENWLYIFWEGERTSETLMQGAEILLKCVQETGCTKIINDSSAFSNAWPNLIDWFAIQYAPRLQAAGDLRRPKLNQAGRRCHSGKRKIRYYRNGFR